MRKEAWIWCIAISLALGLFSMPAIAGVETIIGKWTGKADTPQGLIDLQFELKQEGSQLTGSAMLMQAAVPFSALKFEDPQLSFEISFGGSNYRLTSTVKDGKLSGTWEQIGGDLKGTFSAERQAIAAPAASAEGISGDWNSVAVTPNGELTANLNLKQEGENLTGVISTERGSLEIQKASFKDGNLQFDLTLGDTTYRIMATLANDKFTGKWSPVGGSEGGAWSATRKAGAAKATPAAVPPSESIEGDWNVVATTPDGDMALTLSLKQNGAEITGTLATPEGSVPFRKGTFSDGKLSFEITVGGNSYRVETTLSDGKFRGAWKQIGGTDSGNVTAERKKPQ